MAYQEIANKIAREIRAALPDAKEVARQGACRRSHARAWNGDQAMMDCIVQLATEAKARQFMELPIPDGAPGAIGRCDGVVVRVIRDYDFHTVRHLTRVDVTYI